MLAIGDGIETWVVIGMDYRDGNDGEYVVIRDGI